MGQVYDVNGLEATIVLDTTGDGPMSLILVCNLAPFYKISDHVKNQWVESRGVVTLVDKVGVNLTYVEEGSHNMASNMSLSVMQANQFVRSPCLWT